MYTRRTYLMESMENQWQSGASVNSPPLHENASVETEISASTYDFIKANAHTHTHTGARTHTYTEKLPATLTGIRTMAKIETEQRGKKKARHHYLAGTHRTDRPHSDGAVIGSVKAKRIR